MIYLIKNLSGSNTIVVASVSELPHDNIYNTDNGEFRINNVVFADCIITYAYPDSLDVNQQLLKIVDNLYKLHRDTVLLQNRHKFIIATIKYLPNNTKDVIYINFYRNLLKNPNVYNDEYNENYHNLLENSPWHHYEILNYHTGKFEVHIKCDDAMQKLNQYMNEFAVEYRPNIVKEFSTKEQFLEYIK
jgi:hypothetical protein